MDLRRSLAKKERHDGESRFRAFLSGRSRASMRPVKPAEFGSKRHDWALLRLVRRRLTTRARTSTALLRAQFVNGMFVTFGWDVLDAGRRAALRRNGA
jgi:hypothetical protein